MTKAPRKEESVLEELQTNEFSAGVIRGLNEFKAGKGKTFSDKVKFLDSLKDL